MEADDILGRWFHLHEEDDGQRMVYRDSSRDFPRTRAPRESLTFHADGTVDIGQPTAADGTTATTGHWTADQGRLTITVAQQQRRYSVASLGDGDLVLEPVQGDDDDGNRQRER